ncbi:MAG: hypothetical protein NTX40_11175, partial [Planctomycetota bacterium]|nr:hypothetical protein [Planctomycetota bacterium]
MRRSSIVAMGLGVVLAVSGPSGAGGAADGTPGRSCAPEPLEVAPSADPLGEALRYYARGRTHMDEGEHALAAGDLRKAALLAPNVLRIRQFLGAAIYE